MPSAIGTSINETDAPDPMDTSAPFRLTDWLVEPSLNCISRDGTTIKVDGRHMRVLLLLAKHAGEIVSVQQIEDEVWRNEVVTQNSIHQAIAQLRKGLGDDRKAPRYIETVARKGYRLVASVDSNDCISTGASCEPESLTEPDPTLSAPEERPPILERPAGMAPEPHRSQTWTSVFSRLDSRVIATAAILLATLGAVVTWRYYVAESAAKETASADELSEFMLQVFSVNTHPNGETTARALTDSATQRLVSNTRLQPLARARMLTSIGKSYIRLGKADRAEQPLREAIGIYKALNEERSLAETLLEFSIVLWSTGRFSDAEAALTQASSIQVALGDAAKELKSQVLYWQAVYEAYRGRHSNAVRFFKQALEEGRKVLGPRHSEVAVTLGMLGSSYLALGEPTAAEPLLREAIGIHRMSEPELSPNRVMAEYMLGELLRAQRRFDEAAAIYERVLESQRRLYNSEGMFFAYTLGKLGEMRTEQRRVPEGIQMLGDAIGLLRAEGDAGDDDRAFFQHFLAHTLLELGDYAGSERLIRDSLDVFQRRSKDIDNTSSGEYLLGASLLGQDRLREASVALNSALNRARENNAQRWRIERIRNALGEVLYREGRILEGSRMLRESHDWLANDRATNPITSRIVKKRMKWFAGLPRNKDPSAGATVATTPRSNP
jgi:DNA-binding winged helix-turn-helix (wHTH) protein/tetratricopeptide (TPR) repeat protein